MANETYYYRTTHPQVQAHMDEVRRLWDAFMAQADSLKAEYPGYEIVRMQTRAWGADRRQVVGLDGAEKPEGPWIKRAGESYWSPSLRSKAGKALAERLHAIEFVRPELPGMPPLLWEGMSWGAPGFYEFPSQPGVYWVSWSMRPEIVEADPGFNPEIWSRAKASDYWQAKEAQQAAERVAADSASPLPLTRPCT